MLSVMRTVTSCPQPVCRVSSDKKVQLASPALPLLLLSNHLDRSRSLSTMSYRAQTLAILRLDIADRAVFRVAGEMCEV